ncbi:MAG: efflux RND transporter periplasmic adaptor subunit [Gammaproteobacteria bacterium]
MIISKKQSNISWLFSGTFLCLLLCQLLLSCDNSAQTSVSKHREQQALHRVEVITVENKAVALTQTVSGTLEAVTKIRLYNEESARISKLPYHEGDYVKKGTLLIELDNELLKTDVAKAKASKEQAKLDLSRLKKLLPKKIATEEEVARARTELDLAIAEEKRQLTRLRRTRIKAPIDGLITKRLYEPGDMLAQQSHILTIIDPTALRLKASLAERWLPLVKKGQLLTLSIDALGDTAFSAKVVRIHPTINASTHKGIIEILLSPVPKGATVGQFTRASLELTATNRRIIPVHTIHYDPEGAYVFRVIEDKKGKTVAEKVYFEQGQQFASVTEILSGLNPGERIVSRGFLGLRTDKKVDVAKVNGKKISGSQTSAQDSNSVINSKATKK